MADWPVLFGPLFWRRVGSKQADLQGNVRHADLVDGMSRREAARIFGINRRTVEKMLRFSIPPGYRRDKVLRRPKLDAYTGIMDQILGADRLVPKKQRHTSKRIFERQRDEHGFEGSITIVKNYIYVAKQHQREMFVPLTHPPGHAQADCDDALAIIGGIERKTHFFGMDLPHSDACFVKAYLADTTETFCDAHVAAFAFSGDVPKSILYDNTRIAVARGRATASANVPACSHGWYPVICLGSGNDKGKVEGMVIYTRRNFMVPKPKLASFDDLNAYLAEHRCKRMNDKLRGHKDTIGKQFDVDVNRLQHLPVVPYDACGKQSVRAISLSLMRYRGNNYSVSTTYGHQEVLVCGYICELVT
ncbi:IS21 family transposase [Sulfitobacter guttiformis KCTC 32187]|nr:IS21 family transposase [Sulfitobacter guttiformis KCTC 32187]